MSAAKNHTAASNLSRGKPTRRSRRGLMIRMLMAKVEWLGGSLCWKDGRIAWDGLRGASAPLPADLARAQRTLNKIAQHPSAAEAVMGDSQSWLANRRHLLERAKWLRACEAPDLPELAHRAHHGHLPSIRALVPLLAAEALCQNDLPASPACALAALGPAAAEPLRDLLNDPAAPLPGRALAALVLGAIHRSQGAMFRELCPRFSPCVRSPNDALNRRLRDGDGWLNQAFIWGSQHGLPPYPVQVLTLLAYDRGLDLARRFLAAATAPGLVRLSPAAARAWIAEGLPPERVVELMEVVSTAAPIANRLLEPVLEMPRRSSRMTMAQVLQQRRQERDGRVALLNNLFETLASRDRDPEVIRLAIELVNSVLSLHHAPAHTFAAAAGILRRVLNLPGRLHAEALALLNERHSQVWDPTSIPAARTGLAPWFKERLDEHVLPLLDLLHTSRSAAVARKALDLGIHRVLSRSNWSDPGMYAYLMELADQFGIGAGDREIWGICAGLGELSNVSTARRLIDPIIRAGADAPAKLQWRVLSGIVEDMCAQEDVPADDALRRVIRYVPTLLRYAAADPEFHRFHDVIEAPLALDRANPEAAPIFLEWLVDFVSQMSPEENDQIKERVSEVAGLAGALAGPDLSRFQSLFRALLFRSLRRESADLNRVLFVLQQFPFLREPMAQIILRQANRSLRLLTRVDRLSGLGAAAPLGVLQELPDTDPALDRDPHWKELLALAPDLRSRAAAYRHFRRLAAARPDVPPGIRKVLESPRRMAWELEYLERLAVSQPENSTLPLRAANLRARLSYPDSLSAGIREDLRERLDEVSADAWLDAAETLLTAGFRARLEQLAGPLPPDLIPGDDMVNAIVLAGGIEVNRRLLRRLLRANLQGDPYWQENHPANIAFLNRLADRGVDVELWLSTWPQSYPCPGSPGGTIQLYLERDPLRILQMGNHFQTCLSVGDSSAYSTVANACECNKRVIYAADSRGRIVGRKLIGINTEGDLIGFRTYTSLSDDAANQSLRMLFRQYVAEFAAACHLPLAAAGTIPTLFAQRWYDDGAVKN